VTTRAWRHLPAATALLMGVALAAAANLTAAPEWRRLSAIVAGAGVVLLAAALWWRPAALAGALGLLALPLAFALPDRGGLFVPAVAWTAGLVTTGELAGWAYDRRGPTVPSPSLRRGQAATLVAVVAGSVVLGLLVLVVSGLPAPGGVLPEALGLAGALGIVLLATVRRGPSRQGP